MESKNDFRPQRVKSDDSMSLRLTEFFQNRNESVPGLQVIGPQPVQRDQEQRLLLKATTSNNQVIN